MVCRLVLVSVLVSVLALSPPNLRKEKEEAEGGRKGRRRKDRTVSVAGNEERKKARGRKERQGGMRANEMGGRKEGKGW